MTTIYLVRHATNDSLGHWVAGWTPGLHLNEEGRRQSEALAERMAVLPLQAIYSSPLERAAETAAPLAARLGLEVQTRIEFGEVRFGEWDGRSLDSLEQDPLWKLFHRFRGGTRPPGGETTAEVVARVSSGLLALRETHPDQTVAVFTHADAIKSVLAWLLSVPLDAFWRMEISPASVTTLELEERFGRVLGVNDTGSLPGSPR